VSTPPSQSDRRQAEHLLFAEPVIFVAGFDQRAEKIIRLFDPSVVDKPDGKVSQLGMGVSACLWRQADANELVNEHRKVGRVRRGNPEDVGHHLGRKFCGKKTNEI
jgi:hypothetical protein